MGDEPTHYDVLKVSQDADTDIIRAAYRVMAKKYHPDTFSGEAPPAASQAMSRLNLAHEVLSNPDRRAEYDRSLQREQHSRPLPSPEPEPEPQYFDYAPEPEPDREDEPPSVMTWMEYWDYPPTRKIILIAAICTGVIVAVITYLVILLLISGEKQSLVAVIVVCVAGATVMLTSQPRTSWIALIVASAMVVSFSAVPTSIYAGVALGLLAIAILVSRMGFPGVMAIQAEIVQSKRDRAEWIRERDRRARAVQYAEKARARRQAREERRNRRQ